MTTGNWVTASTSNASLLVWSTLRRDAQEVRCDYCWVEPGEPCVTSSGKTAAYPHAVRWNIAEGYVPAMHLIREQP